MFIQKRKITANEDLGGGAVDTTVAPEATDLLFEAEDVAELIAEVTGEPVEVTAEDDTVTFAVGDTEFTVEAEGTEEILEASTKTLRGKKPVKASTARKTAGRPIKKVPSKA